MEREQDPEGMDEAKPGPNTGFPKLNMKRAAGEASRMPRDALLLGIDPQTLEQRSDFPGPIRQLEPMPVRKLLGYPDFRPSEALEPAALTRAWERLSSLLQEKHVRVDFLADYPLALKYDFIVEELLDEETDLPEFEGMFVCYIYEEFHPNHDYDIRSRTEEFMDGFYSGRFPLEIGWYLADVLITDQGAAMPRAELQSLLDRFHDLFASIKSYSYQIKATTAQHSDDPRGDMPGLGFSEGTVKCQVVLADGAEQVLAGPFKLYLQCRYGWWEIYFFSMPGFSWA